MFSEIDGKALSATDEYMADNSTTPLVRR